MVKKKPPDEVEEKNYSDSLELFEDLFQEELKHVPDKKSPSKGTTAVQSATPKTLPNQQTRKKAKVNQKEQPSGSANKIAVKNETTTPKTTNGQESIGRGMDSETGGAKAELKSAPVVKAPSTGKQKTLEMTRKGAQPKLKPKDVEENAEIEREFGPQGIVLKGVRRINASTSGPTEAPVAQDKVGKLDTPKESKHPRSGVPFKESIFYKVILTGFAFAIVVVVLINFFWIIGADDSKKTSNPVKKEGVEKTSTKKLPVNIVNEVKAPRQKRSPRKAQTENRITQKRAQRQASTSDVNQIHTKSNLMTTPDTATVPVSKSQPKTVLVNRNQPQQDNRLQALAPKSAPQPNTAIRTPAPQTSSSPESHDSSFSSPETNTTLLKTTDDEKSHKPVVATGAETMTPPVPMPITPATQKSADKHIETAKVVERAFPYSVYLGSYKTFKRAKVEVSLYQEQGLSPYWVKVDLGSKGTWFRIFAGHFQNKQEAQYFIDQRDLKEASVKKTRYSALIGVYSSKDAIEKKSEALLKLGYSAYAIKGGNGSSQLYIGAFDKMSDVEKLFEELLAKGIQNQIVER
jgi:hypothetical protein